MKLKNLFFLIIFFICNNSIAGNKIIPIIEGNANAKVKILVYESLTCSHCANFHKDVYPQLKEEFLDKGLASIEFRNFPLDIAALNASKLAHCKNDGKSKILHFLYLKQKEWIEGNTIEELNSNLKEIIKDQNFGLDYEKCVYEGGNFAGDGTSCAEELDAGTCEPPPTGACCVDDTCSETTAELCHRAGGLYYGDGTQCVDGDRCPDSEEPASGACCLPSGQCVDSTEEECLHADGLWLDDESCDNAITSTGGTLVSTGWDNFALGNFDLGAATPAFAPFGYVVCRLRCHSPVRRRNRRTVRRDWQTPDVVYRTGSRLVCRDDLGGVGGIGRAVKTGVCIAHGRCDGKAPRW